MKKIIAITLAVLLVIMNFAACGGQQAADDGVTSGYGYKSSDGYEAVNGRLSWDAINAIPVKSADMTEQQLRKICVDMHRLSREFVWVSNAELRYLALSDYDYLRDGEVYAGFPYMKQGTGNVYRVMDYMDPDTGVVDIATAGQTPGLFGNMCSCSAWWGWARVVNSAEYMYSKHATAANGCLPVGAYVYDASATEYTPNYGTGTICTDTGEEGMFECYALMKMADGLVCNTPGSHIVMVASDAVVVRDENGKIDPDKSTVTIIDQTTKWRDGATADGKSYKTTGNMDEEWTFAYLLKKSYVPFTFAEFTGEDPVEETEVSFSHNGQTITKDQLFASKITSNYAISDVYAIVSDSKGNEVYRHAVRAAWPCMMELAFTFDSQQSFPNAEADKDCISTWGTWDNIKADESYTVKVIAQLGTGERPTLWEGKLAQ